MARMPTIIGAETKAGPRRTIPIKWQFLWTIPMDKGATQTIPSTSQYAQVSDVRRCPFCVSTSHLDHTVGAMHGDSTARAVQPP